MKSIHSDSWVSVVRVDRGSNRKGDTCVKGISSLLSRTVFGGYSTHELRRQKAAACTSVWWKL